MAIQRTKSGKIDKRTKEGKAMLENLAKARAAAAKKRKKEAQLKSRTLRASMVASLYPFWCNM